MSAWCLFTKMDYVNMLSLIFTLLYTSLNVEGTAKLNVPRVLLPVFNDVSINFTLEVSGTGCYEWSTSRPDLLSIREVYENKANLCSKQAVITVLTKELTRKTAIIIAEDIAFHQTLRADIILDVISCLRIVTGSPELYMEEPPQKFEVRAYINKDKSPRVNSVTDTIKSSKKKLAANVVMLQRAKRSSENSQKLPRTNSESEKEKDGPLRGEGASSSSQFQVQSSGSVEKPSAAIETKKVSQIKRNPNPKNTASEKILSSDDRGSSERVSSTKRRRRRSHLTMRRKKKVPKPKNNEEEIPSCNEETDTADDSVLSEEMRRIK